MCALGDGGVHLLVEQVGAMLVQLMLLHQHVRCVVDPKFYGDEVKEEVRLLIMGCNVVM